MKLKTLTICGFKSFAEKVTLHFDCEIIGIVGPNGCGKSNIVDALRWVMGEQSARSLRGGKMQDILFAGTDQRKPFRYAEVSVTLAERVCSTELTVTRRLYQSGESEYLVNHEPALLRTIQELLLKSGIGKNAFSIFEQGQLDQVIHLSPLERRMIFDEAAGTALFLLRKRETLRKLASVSENFMRVHDVHAEVEKQIRQLKKQASHAKIYQESVSRLEELEKNTLLCRWQSLAEKSTRTQGALHALTLSLQEERATLAGLEQFVHRAQHAWTQDEQLAKQQQQELNLCETQVRVHSVEVAQHKHRIAEIKKREESLKAHAQQVSREQEARRVDVERREQELQRLTPHVTTIDSLKEAVRIGRQEYVKKIQEEGRLASELRERALRYEVKNAHLSALHALEKTQAQSHKGYEEQIVAQQVKVDALKEHIDTFKGELDQLEQDVQLLRKQQTEAYKEEQEEMRRVTEIEGQRKVLQRLKEEMEGFSAGAKALLKEAQHSKSPLYQKVRPLFEYFTPHKGYEAVVASAVQAYADTLVVASEEDFAALVTLAKTKNISGFSVVVAECVAPSTVEGATGRALSLHVEKNQLAHHFTHGFTLASEGDFYDALGVFFHVGPGKKPHNAFYRQAELHTLSETLSQLQQGMHALAEARTHSVDRLKRAEKRRSEVSEVRRREEMDLIQANFALQRALHELEKLESAKASLKEEKESLSHLYEEEQKIGHLQKQAQALKAEIVEFSASLQQQESLLEKWQESDQQIQILHAQQHQSALHEKKILEDLTESRRRLEHLLIDVTHREQEREKATASLAALRAKVMSGEMQLMESRKAHEHGEKELVQKKRSVEALEREKHALEVVLAQDISEKKAIERELIERHSFALEKHQESYSAYADMDLEEAAQEIHRLRSILDSTGAVNLAAIEELRQTQARFDYLDCQLKDLEESKREMEAIITKLDQESRKIFRSVFQQIRDSFQKNFALLFNGGAADLTFTESVDILEAGVEIVAKPPGKHMRSISLLSGGEKCLTALALLFSIFEVKPAPFCILDEVDAPLDESNIDRFTSIVRKFSENTQFLIVTHNKKTMATADLLIGISMEEKGVFKLISLAFEKASRSMV